MSNNTVKLKSYVDIIKERVAAAAITPGMLIEITGANKVQAHNSAGQNAARIFALEDALQGKDLGDNYAVAAPVQCWHVIPGEEVYAILADGEDVDEGDFLESAGDGYLQKHTPDVVEGISSAEASSDVTVYSHQIVAVALEDINISSSSGVESSGEGTIDDAIGYARRIKVLIV